MITVFRGNNKTETLKKINFWVESFFRRKIDIFTLLKEYLESIDGNNNELVEIGTTFKLNTVFNRKTPGTA